MDAIILPQRFTTFKDSVLSGLKPSAFLLFLTLFLGTVNAFADEASSTSTSAGNLTCTNNDGNSSCSDAVQFSDVGSTGSSNFPSDNVGNPINLMSGNKFQQETDFSLPGASLMLNRMFNSANADNNIGLGQGWHHSYAVSLYDAGDGGRDIVQSNGSRLHFKADGEDSQGRAIMRGNATHLGYVVQTDTHHEWHLPDGRTLVFQGSFLVRIDWPDQRRLELFYRANRLHSVTDETGRVLRFEYHAGVSRLTGYDENRFGVQAGHLANVTLPDGSILEYDYDHNRNLSRVRYEDGTSREYHYENAVYPNVLTGITNRLGVRYASWTYDDQGRAISSEHAGGVEQLTIEHPDPVSVSNGDVVTTLITNSLGYQSSFTWQQIDQNSRPLLLSSEGPGCATCPETGFEYTYDDQGRLLTSRRTGQGNAVGLGGLNYQYEDLGRIAEVTRTDSQGQVQLIARYEYDNDELQATRTFRPSVNPNGETLIEVERDDQGLPVKITSRGWAPTSSSANTDANTEFKPIERISTMGYEQGRLVSIDGPREDVEDVTRFGYDPLGRLDQMVLASGETIVISEFDVQGRAKAFRRGQHPQVTLAYDDNGNVSRVTQLGQSVIYTYNAENQLVEITNPNGKTSKLRYDEANRLTQVADDLGRTVTLSLDTESQQHTHSFLGVNGALISSINYVFDAEGRIQSVTEEEANHANGGTIAQTMEAEYDGFGNLIGGINLDTGAQRSFVVSDLGRLLESTAPNGLSQKKAYDIHNRLIAQTDKRLNTTEYLRDDFGLVHFLKSPDTGITQYDFDTAGNRIFKRNANGETTHYRWDAANRLVEQDDPDGQTTYEYNNTNGRLVETVNPYTTERYTYTRLAQLETHTRVIDGREFTTRYAYASNGKLHAKTLPDGQVLRYHYYESGPSKDTLRAITRSTLFGLSQSTLVGEIDLDWRDGGTSHLSHNGRRSDVQYHADGKASSVAVTDTLALEYEYDEQGNIAGIVTDGINQRYEHTANRLSSAETLIGRYDYRYDVTGNRTGISSSTTTTTGENNNNAALSYRAASEGNRLDSWFDSDTQENVEYRYNDAGSPVSIGELSYVYNTDQRPVSVSRGGNLIAEYRYNSFGERVKKVTYAQNQKKVTYYLYENHTLVAEVDGESLEHRQTVYLKHTPVAHLIGKNAYAVHTDNLGTPKLLTNDSGDVAWEAAHTPLGLAVIDKEEIEFNLRFPGQYADAETGTHYNYLRDYDPRTGRYLTSDPIGLEGGENTYAYASNNVLEAIDVFGLSDQLANVLQTQNIDQVLASNSNNDVTTFSNRSVNSIDPSDQGITDPNQLILDFSSVGGGCVPDGDRALFEQGLENGVFAGEGVAGVLNPDEVRIEISHLVDRPNNFPGRSESNGVVLEALNSIGVETVGSDSFVLSVGECASDGSIEQAVKDELGGLVQPEEITALIGDLKPAEPGETCRPAQLVDLTELHAAVLERFQLKLATDQRVVDAEKAFLLAQDAHDSFLEIHSDPHPCAPTVTQGMINVGTYIDEALCDQLRVLEAAADAAADDYADILKVVTDEQIAAGLLPRFNLNQDRNDFQAEIFIAVISIFVPTNLTDAAIELGTFGVSKVGRVFRALSDVVGPLSSGLARVNKFLDNGRDTAKRADEIKKAAAYGNLDSFAGIDYADIVRIEGKVGADNLTKLNNDFASDPALAAAFKNDPSLANDWNYWDELGDTEMRRRVDEIPTGSAAGVAQTHPNHPLTAVSMDRDETRLVLGQGNTPTCGQVSCAMVTDTTGQNLDPTTLIQQTGPVPTNRDELAILLEGNGVPAVAEHGRRVNYLRDITANGTPAIARITGSNGFSHWVVVDGVTIRNGVEVVAIRDPHGQAYFTPLSVFNRHFSGDIVRPL